MCLPLFSLMKVWGVGNAISVENSAYVVIGSFSAFFMPYNVHSQQKAPVIDVFFYSVELHFYSLWFCQASGISEQREPLCSPITEITHQNG